MNFSAGLVVSLRPAIVASGELLCFGTALPSIFQPRASLIVLGAGGGEAAELEVPLVENPIPVPSTMEADARARREDQVDHHGRRLPFAGGYARVEVGIPGPE